MKEKCHGKIRKEKDKPNDGSQERTKFKFFSPEAVNVFLTGDFNDWNTQSLPMKKGKEGIWKAKIDLEPGRYEYKFYADNAWIEDLPDSETVYNPFGTKNYIISV